MFRTVAIMVSTPSFYKNFSCYFIIIVVCTSAALSIITVIIVVFETTIADICTELKSWNNLLEGERSQWQMQLIHHRQYFTILHHVMT